MKDYWNHHNLQIQKLKKIYDKLSLNTRNRIQEVLDTFDFTDKNIYEIADKKTKRRINEYIAKWRDEELLQDYFEMLANSIYMKTRVKNSEILELLIYSAYIEEYKKQEEKEIEVFKEDINYYYNEGINEVRKAKGYKEKHSIIPEAVFLILIDSMNSLGYTWRQYINLSIMNNVNQIYRQVLINIQQQKELKMDSDEFKVLLDRQDRQRLNINGDKISGAVDNELVGLCNQAKIKGIEKEDSNAQVRFIAVTDSNSTAMCQSMNNKLFYINKLNEFYRMYGETKNDLRNYKIRAKGLVLGINLPPISHFWHWCRSTIMYVNPVEKQDKTEYNDLEYPSYIRLNVDKGYKPESEIDTIVNAITKIPPNVRDLVEDTQYEIFSLGKVYRNNEVVKNSFYDRKENKIYILDGQNLTEGEVIHEIGHVVETKLGILNNTDYIRIRSYGLENYSKSSIKPNEELGADCIKNSKFISDLQGKVYKRDLDGNYRTYSNDSLNLNCLGDYFSEGFREYIENKGNLLKNDKELYNYIRGVINGL